MPLVLDEPGLQTADLLVNEFGVMMDAPSPEGWLVETSADGTDWGNPEAVISSIQSQLQDGSLESHDRDDNRQASVAVMISAPGAVDPGRVIALAQRSLELACRWPAGQVRQMRWTSPLAGAQTTVFEMTSATVQRATAGDWDLDEVLHQQRLFTLTIHARPFVRGTVPVTIEAQDVSGSTTTTVDSGSSTTGWSLLSTAPAPMKNLITNPSFEASTTGWTAGSGTAAAVQDGGQADAGTKSLVVTSTASTGRSYVNGPSTTVAAAKVYAVGASTRGTGLGSNLSINQIGSLVRFYNGSGTQLGGDNEMATTPASVGAWKRWKGNRTAPAGAASARLLPFANGNGLTSTFGWWLDRAFVIEVTADNPDPDYFDGGTVNTAALAYTWDGTANASTSTATWTAPSLAVSGGVRGTVYGRASASIRRGGTIDMSSLNYMRIKGTASAFSDGLVTVADNGGTQLTPVSYTYNQTTGAFEILIKRPEGFAAVDVTFTRTGGTISTTSGLFVAVSSIVITNAPFGTGAVQSRQVQIYGSQRTELSSLLVLGLNTAGTTPVGHGDQVAVYTAAAGDDGRAKFLACRAASTVTPSPTVDATATSGVYNSLNNIASGTYPIFATDSAALLPGTYDVYGNLQITAAGTHTVSLRADLDAGLDTVRVGAWQDTLITTGSAWPQIPTAAYRLVPLGTVTIGEDGGTLSLSTASASTTSIRIDDLFLFHRRAGQLSILDTKTATGSFSAVELRASTVTSANPSAWVGVANGKMMDAALAGRCQAFDQHQAEPGLLQVVTITPGCKTSRVSATYFERFAHNAASIAEAA